MRTLIGRNVYAPVFWEPFAEFERFTDEFWRDWEFPASYARLAYADVSEDEDSLVVKAELPGVSPEEIDIAFKDGVLTIKAEHNNDEEMEGNGYHSLRYYRSMTLPPHIDSEKVTAIMEHGLLEVRFPKTESIDTKHVEVKALEELKPKRKRTKRAKNTKKESKGKK